MRRKDILLIVVFLGLFLSTPQFSSRDMSDSPTDKTVIQTAEDTQLDKYYRTALDNLMYAQATHEKVTAVGKDIT